jgi:transcriptional regulator with XRE-family HTH domain
MTEIFFKKFVRDRMEVLGISRNELVRRLGYRNADKGHRRLAEIEADNLRIISLLLTELASALELPVEDLETLINRVEEARRVAWLEFYRANFRPHARFLTERTRPTSIFAAMGSVKILRVDFPDDLPEDQYLGVALQALPDHVTAFGRVTGIEVCYSADLAVRYRPDGTPDPGGRTLMRTQGGG